MKHALQWNKVSLYAAALGIALVFVLFTSGEGQSQDGDGLHLRSPYAEGDSGEQYQVVSPNENDDISTCGTGYLDQCDSQGKCKCIKIDDACALPDSEYKDREADIACDEGYVPQWHQLCGWRCVKDTTCSADTIFKCDIYGCGCKKVDDPAQHWCCPEGYDIVGSTCEKVLGTTDGEGVAVQKVKRKICKEVCKEVKYGTCPTDDMECVPAPTCLDFELECEYKEVEVPDPYKVERVAAQVCTTGPIEEEEEEE